MPHGLIDVHHHFWPRAYMAEEQKRNPGYMHSSADKARLLSWSAAETLATMDQYGVDAAIGSISTPGVWFGDVGAARRLCREWNEAGASTVSTSPHRFGFFAVVAPTDIDGSLQEIEFAIDVLKADGVSLLSNYDGKLLGDDAFIPVFEELNRRKCVVFVHPTKHPATENLIHGLVPQGIEFPFDTMRTIASLVLNGTITRFPDIKFIMSHGAGVLPYLASRLEHVGGKTAKFRDNNPDGIGSSLQRFYCDTAGANSPPQLAAIAEFFPQSRILFGSDYPFIQPSDGMSDSQAIIPQFPARKALTRENALALFPRISAYHRA